MACSSCVAVMSSSTGKGVSRSSGWSHCSIRGSLRVLGDQRVHQHSCVARRSAPAPDSPPSLAVGSATCWGPLRIHRYRGPDRRAMTEAHHVCHRSRLPCRRSASASRSSSCASPRSVSAWALERSDARSQWGHIDEGPMEIRSTVRKGASSNGPKTAELPEPALAAGDHGEPVCRVALTDVPGLRPLPGDSPTRPGTRGGLNLGLVAMEVHGERGKSFPGLVDVARGHGRRAGRKKGG